MQPSTIMPLLVSVGSCRHSAHKHQFNASTVMANLEFCVLCFLMTADARTTSDPLSEVEVVIAI